MNRRYTKKRRSLKKRSLTKKKRKNTFRKQRGGIGGTTQRKAVEAKALAEELYRQEELDRQVEAAAELQRKTVSGILTAKEHEERIHEKRKTLAQGDALSEGADQKVRQKISAAIKKYMLDSNIDNETDVPDEKMLEIIKKILSDTYPKKTDAELDVDSNNRLLLRKMRNFRPSTTQKV